MRSLTWVFIGLLALAAMVLSTCDDSGVGSGGNVQVYAEGHTQPPLFWHPQPDHAGSWLDWQYPLQVGNLWEYVRLESFHNYRPSDEESTIPEPARYSIYVEVENMEFMPGYGQLHRLKETSLLVRGGDENIYYAWYRNESNGLWMYGFEGTPTIVTPAPSPEHATQEQRCSWPGSGLVGMLPPGTQATGEFHEFTCHILKYPLRLDSRWRSSADESAFLIHRRVIGSTRLRVPAGTFDCLGIVWDFHTPEGAPFRDITITDYIAREGLVRRDLWVRDLRLSSYEEPDLGLVDMHSVTELTFVGAQLEIDLPEIPVEPE